MVVTDTPAYKYALWARDETDGLVPVYVRRQAYKWLEIADGDNQDAYVDEIQIEKIHRLLKLIIHPDLRRSMYESLEDYQWFLIIAVLCTICRPESETYKLAGVSYDDVKIRYYETAVLEISRKNYKTFSSATIFILLMLTEPPFSRFYSVAPDLSLSSELKNAINKIIKSSPALYDEVNPAFKLLRKQIICKLNDNEYTPLAYSEDRLDGRQANGFVSDEAAGMPAYPTAAMRSSQITLLSKLGIIISTQYPNENNGFAAEVDIAKKTLDGVLNTKYFSLLYEPDDELKEGDVWQTDDRCIYQSNPISIKNRLLFSNLKQMRELAVLYEDQRENFLCKHLNVLYKGLGVSGYIDPQLVKLCAVDYPPEWWNGRRVWLGLDLSQTDDNTAVAMVTEEDGDIYGQVFGFLPGNDKRIYMKSTKEKFNYKDSIERGECFACGDEVIDYGFVERFITETIPNTYGVDIVQVGYDRYNAISTVQKLEAEGLECVEIKQHSSVLHMPTKLLKESILNRSFFYIRNQLLELNFSNARCTKDTNQNLYVNKKKSSGKVDMVVALINAMYLLQQDLLYGREEIVQF